MAHSQPGNVSSNGLAQGLTLPPEACIAARGSRPRVV